MKPKNYYINLRNKYLPDKIKTVFILESPPVSGKYFYDNSGLTSEPLFLAMMKLLRFYPFDKEEGLKHFSSKGCLLVDATYTQVNELKNSDRNKVILNDFQNLLGDLDSLGIEKGVELILVKKNICELLEKKLKESGFNVRNEGVMIPFPSTGQQKKFHERIEKIYQGD